MTNSTSERFTPTDWTQPTGLQELLQQKALLIGVGAAVGAFLLFARRKAPEEKAARRLVRDWRHVDDAGDLRDLLGDTLPPIIRPVLLIALGEIERPVHHVFENIEREIQRL
jgi:hypothetical protein